MIIQKSFKNSNPNLFIVPTPIGNLDDITIRAINTLKEVDIIFCEDKRITKKLLNHYEINTPLSNYHDHNSEEATINIKNILSENKDVAIVSDAGMPIISDPGFEVVKMCKECNFNIICLPGPTAFILPIIQSGFKNDEFKFIGFLSKKESVKKDQLKDIISSNITTSFYESTHKINKTLKYIDEINSEILINVGRELTKIHEEYVQGTANELIKYYEENSFKGEFVVVINANDENLVPELTIDEYINYLNGQNIDKKEIIKKTAQKYKVHKNEIYKKFFND